MLRRAGIEAVAGQEFFAAKEANAAHFGGNGNGAAHTAIRAGAAADGVKTIAEGGFEADAAAVALAGVDF